MQLVILLIFVGIVVANVYFGYRLSEEILGDEERINTNLEVLLDRPDEADAFVGSTLREDVIIGTDISTLRGDYYEHPNQECAVLLLHGINGNRNDMYPWAETVWSRNCSILMYDHRGHGASTGAYKTYGHFEKQDASEAYDWLLNRSSLEADRVGVFGVSYGAATALQMLDERQDMAFIIADSPYENLVSVLNNELDVEGPAIAKPFLPAGLVTSALRAGFNPLSVSPKNSVKDVTVPIFITVVEQDTKTPADHSRRIAAENEAAIQLIVTDYAQEHTKAIEVDPERYSKMINNYLDSIEF